MPSDKPKDDKPGHGGLICPFHLNLGDDQVANDLTSRLDRPQFKQVIETDIASPKAGTPAHAQEIDEAWIEEGRPPYAHRVATTVFLHSLVQTGQSGVDPADLRVAVLQPNDDPALVSLYIYYMDTVCQAIERSAGQPLVAGERGGPIGEGEVRGEVQVCQPGGREESYPIAEATRLAG